MKTKKKLPVPIDSSKRHFLNLTVTAMSGISAAAFAWPFIDSMNPSRDQAAFADVEVDLSKIEEGEIKTVTWRGKPVFIRHRTNEEIQLAKNILLKDLKDPTLDNERVQNPKWLIVIGVCTHLGCIPSGNKTSQSKGDFGGWLCPCHASHYDTSGRIRRGPAPKNLGIPPYKFIDENTVKIGAI